MQHADDFPPSLSLSLSPAPSPSRAFFAKGPSTIQHRALAASRLLCQGPLHHPTSALPVFWQHHAFFAADHSGPLHHPVGARPVTVLWQDHAFFAAPRAKRERRRRTLGPLGLQRARPKTRCKEGAMLRAACDMLLLLRMRRLLLAAADRWLGSWLGGGSSTGNTEVAHGAGGSRGTECDRPAGPAQPRWTDEPARRCGAYAQHPIRSLTLPHRD